MRGQTIVEYVILIGIITAVLYAMGPTFKRGVQSVLRGTSDQLALQNSAEQDFEQSYLENMSTKSKMNNQRSIKEVDGSMTTLINEQTESVTETVTNMGFTSNEIH